MNTKHFLTIRHEVAEFDRFLISLHRKQFFPMLREMFSLEKVLLWEIGKSGNQGKFRLVLIDRVGNFM